MKRMMLTFLTLCFFLASMNAAAQCSTPCSSAADQGKDKAACADTDAVKAVIESAYLKGIHTDRDLAAIEKGFHPDFAMLVKKENAMDKVTIAAWMEKIKKWKEQEPGPLKVKITWKFPVVEISGDAAIARVEVFKDGEHVFTDFMSLYKFSDGWKIVNKIYQTHKKNK